MELVELPNEIITIIISYLPLRDVKQFSSCSQWAYDQCLRIIWLFPISTENKKSSVQMVKWLPIKILHANYCHFDVLDEDNWDVLKSFKILHLDQSEITLGQVKNSNDFQMFL